MELCIGDKIIYKDVYGDCFKGLIIEIWTDDDQEITNYFAVTNSGLYIHIKPSSLEWVHLDKSVSVN
jgi:hypothetical protein